MNKLVYDESFNKMAVDLSFRRGSEKEVADEFGLSHSLLSKQRQRLCEPKQGAIDLTEDQKMIKKLQRELKDANQKKGGRHLFQRRREIFGFIKEHRKVFPVEKMCKVLAVSTSGFCYWLKHPISLGSIKLDGKKTCRKKFRFLLR